MNHMSTLRLGCLGKACCMSTRSRGSGSSGACASAYMRLSRRDHGGSKRNERHRKINESSIAGDLRNPQAY